MAQTQSPEATLKAFVARYPTQRAAAEALGINPSYLTDLLYGRRQFSARILERLGLQRIVTKIARTSA